MWWYESFCTNGFNTGLGGDRAWRWSQERVNAQLAKLPEMVWKHDRKDDVCELFWDHIRATKKVLTAPKDL